MARLIPQQPEFASFLFRFAFLAALAALLLAGHAAQAAPTHGRAGFAPDESRTVELSGNTRPEARRPAHDRGALADGTRLEHLQLLLRRPPAVEAALVQRIDELHDPDSPYFQHWLSAEQLRAQFGPPSADVLAVGAWLEAHGMTVHGLRAAGTVIDFSASVRQLREAFHTEIHALQVHGVAHYANTSDPRIPAALAHAVHGVVALHDFRPHTNFRPRARGRGAAEFTIAGGALAVVPADLWTIYNFLPLFAAGVTGKGQTVAVIEDSDVYDAADWQTFRRQLGLAAYTGGSFTQVHPAPLVGANNCTPPGVVNPDEGEAILDAEWASAAAPDAAIVLASCGGNSGLLIAAQNLLDGDGVPPIMSISYGYCESQNGAAANAAFYSLYQQAVAEGVSVFVAAGDQLSGACDINGSNASNFPVTHGIAVSGYASTPYNVAVGGTDFADTYLNATASYWNAQNSAVFGSALSYVPEIPWNDSCANALQFAYANFSAAYDTTGYCNSSGANPAALVQNVGGSGGPSGCATGNAPSSGVVGGTCQGWPKPAWQSVLGNPVDGVRDIPDVSMFAADGSWSHYFVFCDSDVGDGGAVCAGTTPDTWSGAGGTSFGTPILAGVQALIDQRMGGRQGNPNPTYYALARHQYGSSGSSACDATLGNGVASTCTFYDVTQGDIDPPCTGSVDCYLPGGQFGVLSLSSGAAQPAFPATTGWDFATGIGTINVANLVRNYSGARVLLSSRHRRFAP